MVEWCFFVRNCEWSEENLLDFAGRFGIYISSDEKSRLAWEGRLFEIGKMHLNIVEEVRETVSNIFDDISNFRREIYGIV